MIAEEADAESPYQLSAPAVSDRSFRVVAIATLLSVITVLMFVVLLTVFRFQDHSTVTAQKKTVDRQDCARRIANEQQDVRDRRDNVIAAIVLTSVERNLDLPPTASIATLRTDLSDAVTDVQALPPTQQLVESQCPAP